MIEAVFEDLEVKGAPLVEARRARTGAHDLRLEHELDLDRCSSPRRSRRARRQRFVGMHFFSPVPVMPLVELIRGSATSDATEAAIRELTEALGKKLIVSADRPGFIVNRILMPMLAEAMRILEEGSGTADDIDTGAKVGLNHPDGPARAGRLHRPRRLPQRDEGAVRGHRREHYPPPKVLVDLVEAGHLGQKTGRGFHTYPRG